MAGNEAIHIFPQSINPKENLIEISGIWIHSDITVQVITVPYRDSF